MLNLLLSAGLVSALPHIALEKRQPAPAPAPTLFTFTYEGQPVTATWTGTGNAAQQTDAAACPSFTIYGQVVPYTGPGVAQSCLNQANAPAATTQAPVATNAPVQATTQVQSTTPVAATIASAAASSSSAAASNPLGAYLGFNYGALNGAGVLRTESDFVSLFNTAKSLAGGQKFTSARLFTMIQGGTTNSPISAIPAAISTNTSLLLGLWASSGQANIDNELAALSTAISQYGTAFTKLVAGISVGSEDLYRNSPTGIQAGSNPGANPDTLISFIAQTRAKIAGTSLSTAPVGHVDTWTAYVNGTNAAVISAMDFVGVDAYPYFQNTMSNGIDVGLNLFDSAYQATVAVSGGKPVWITETGWPVSGPTENLAVASVANSKSYYDAICGEYFGKVNTWYYQIDDAPSSPSFGVTVNGSPLFDLTCSAL